MKNLRRIHIIDGQEMTVPEIAEMLGISEGALYQRRYKLHGCGYQTIVNMYRRNQFPAGANMKIRHLVDGQWITVEDVSKRFGVAESSIYQYRQREKQRTGKTPTMDEIVAHFRAYETGDVKRWKGSAPKRHRVYGRMMTVKEAAEMCGTTEETLYSSMEQRHRTLEGAVKRVEYLQKRRAQKEIMRIIRGE